MTSSQSLPHHGPAAPHVPGDLYAYPPPWDIGRPQPAFAALAEAGAIRGRVLDASCGTGEHVLMCAALGLDVTGVDLSASALRAAQAKARDRGLTARFLRQDARHLAHLGERFGTVLDCGLFHVFTDADRRLYTDSLRAALEPGGRHFMLCFSNRQPGQWGPVRKITREEITATFAGGWRVDSVQPAIIDITADPAGIRAWLAVLTRT